MDFAVASCFAVGSADGTTGRPVFSCCARVTTLACGLHHTKALSGIGYIVCVRAPRLLIIPRSAKNSLEYVV